MIIFLNKKYRSNHLKSLFFCCFFCILFFSSNPVFTNGFNGLDKCIGNRDAIVIAGPNGGILFSKNADHKLIPASTLKILTALVSLHYLGADYRFKTEFYLDRQSNLKIKGYGDPLLISEVLAGIAKTLAGDLKNINDIILDDTYFSHPLTIPGVTESTEPYDAPNGALCANFNTVNFKKNEVEAYISAEPQTPLLPFAVKKIKKSKIDQGRIVLTHEKKEATLYVGYLLSYFLKNESVQHSGKIITGTVIPTDDTLIYTYTSPYTLEQLIAELLEYSNNFIANQLLITAGAMAFGPPGSLEKGIRAVNSYTQSELNINHMDIIEGSGISRKNKTTANHMIKILLRFKPYSYLMRYEKKEYYKTGTLKGVRTRAGYIEGERNELYPFIVILNTPGKSTGAIMKRIKNGLAK